MTALSDIAPDQDIGRAKKAAQKGPIIITGQGRPAFVLMTYTAFAAMKQPEPSIAELLAMPPGGDLDFDFPREPLRARVPDFD